MRQLFVWMVSLLMIGTVACSPSSQSTKTPKIYLLAVASVSDALEEAKTKYTKTNPDVELVLSFASSGKLKQQIGARNTC